MTLNITPNILLPARTDRLGMTIITLKNALVATGLWRVIGSGDGQSAVALVGQTSGPSYDVFTGNGGLGYQTDGIANTGSSAYPNTISRNNAWVILEEITSGRIISFQRGSTSNESSFATRLLVTAAASAASSGATASARPSFTGGTAWDVATMYQSAYNTAGNDLDVRPTSLSTLYMHLWVEDELRNGDVAPWFLVVWNSQDQRPVWCFFWESLVDVRPGVTNPLAVGVGSAFTVAGMLGSSAAGLLGSSALNTAVRTWFGGDSLQALGASVGLCVIPNYGIPSVYEPPESDRITELVEVFAFTSNVVLGRMEHVYWNKTPYQYPNTYRMDGSGGGPLLVFNQFLLPWTTDAEPRA